MKQLMITNMHMYVCMCIIYRQRDVCVMRMLERKRERKKESNGERYLGERLSERLDD